jgi:hypothetical protein
MIEPPPARDRAEYQHAQYLARKARQQGKAPVADLRPDREPRPCPRCAVYTEEVAHLKRLLAARTEPPAKPGQPMFPKTGRPGFGFAGGGVRDPDW